MPICKVIEFNAPPEKVFPWIADPEKNKQWLPGVVSTTYSGDPTQEGTRFVQRIKEGGRVNEYSGEVTAYVKDRQLAITLSGKSMSVAVDYLLEPLPDNRSQLTYTCEFVNPNTFIKIMMFIFGGFTRMMVKKMMEKLRGLVEAS